VLAYCLGDHGLRLTAAWATAIGLADISNVALLYRLRRCGDWLTMLIGQVLAGAAPGVCRGRPIRLIDATSVCQAGAAAKRGNAVWRVHCAFDLPGERFGAMLLTDQHEPERLDRIAVVPGEIRIGDRVYLQPEGIAAVCAQGADVVVRAGWKSACWLDAAGQPVNLPGALRAAAASGWIDRPIWVAREQAPALPLRLVAVRKSEPARAAARRKARRAAQRGMKASTYLAALARAHLRANPPLPASELAALKQSIIVLAALGRVLVETSRNPALAGPETQGLRQQLSRTRAAVEALERHTHELARAALISWETRSE